MPGATVDEYSEFLENTINEDRYGYTIVEPGTYTVSGDVGQTIYYRIDVPANTSRLRLAIRLGTGRVSGYVKEGGLPIFNDFQESVKNAATGSITLDVLSNKDKSYYVKLTGNTKYVNKTATVEFLNP